MKIRNLLIIGVLVVGALWVIRRPQTQNLPPNPSPTEPYSLGSNPPTSPNENIFPGSARIL